MDLKQRITPGELYKAAQSPSQWLIAAQRLVAAAEIILAKENTKESVYLAAVGVASDQATNNAILSDEGVGRAEIIAEEPNYLPAQLLYAYALENVLKGLVVVNRPAIASENKIDGSIKTHDLIKLSKLAKYDIGFAEKKVLENLTRIATWAGRYPVDVSLEKYEDKHPIGLNPDSLLDWGSEHPLLRNIYAALSQKLLSKLGRPLEKYGTVVSFRPKT